MPLFRVFLPSEIEPMRLALSHIVAIALLLVVATRLPAAAGLLSGYAELGYASYQAELGGATVEERSHFTQQYGLAWSDRGQLLDGRGGQYNLLLGAELTSLDGEHNGTDTNIDTSKIFYRGDLLLAPGGLPFRLNLFSYDLNKSSFEYLDDSGRAGPYLSPGAPIISPHIAVDISNGQHVITGATLLAGIRNGSYNGQYRELLANYPRLLMDFRETYVRDMEGDTPQHYRNRNLAFVSLNKKDNWFHYRYNDYTDFMDHDQDYVEKSYMIGTIDHVMKRHWINMTNWLKISTDASITEVAEENPGRPSGDYWALNVFAAAKRTTFQFNNFTTYERFREEAPYNRFRKTMTVPFYGSGELSADKGWRAQFVNYFDDDNFISTGRSENEELSYARMTLDLNKNSRLWFSPEAAVEVHNGDRGNGLGFELGGELYTNPKARSDVRWFGSLFASYVNGDGRYFGSESIDYVETRTRGRVEKKYSPVWTAGIEQYVLVGSGTLDDSVAPDIRVEGGLPLLYSDDISDSAGFRKGSTVRLTSTLFGEQILGALKNRYEAIYDRLEISEDVSNQAGDRVILRHRLNYSKQQLYAQVLSQLIYGKGHDEIDFSLTYLGNPQSLSSPDWSLRSTGSLDYRPTRSFVAKASYDVVANAEGDLAVSLGEEMRYGLYKTNGIIREWLNFYQGLEYQYFDVAASNPSAIIVKVGGLYAPLRTVSLGAKLEYQYYMPDNFGQLRTDLSANVDFPKFQVGLNYSYGVRDAVDAYAERTESRWEVFVKKQI